MRGNRPGSLALHGPKAAAPHPGTAALQLGEPTVHLVGIPRGVQPGEPAQGRRRGAVGMKALDVLLLAKFLQWDPVHSKFKMLHQAPRHLSRLPSSYIIISCEINDRNTTHSLGATVSAHHLATVPSPSGVEHSWTS